MKEVEEIDFESVPYGYLVLLTAVTISTNSSLYVADFSDEKAVQYVPTRNFIGISKDRGIRLGRMPHMKNGIWILHEDLEIAKVHYDIRITPENLCFKAIE